MKTKIIKIILLVLILQFAIFIGRVEAVTWDTIFSGAENFLETGRNAATTGNGASTATDSQVKNIMNDLYSILFPLGVITTVIVGGVLGIKFMMASTEDKAKIKESMVPYIAGCVVIYGAFGIWRIAIQIFSEIA